MLPAWATVAVALGGSALGAAAGVFGSYFTLRTTRLSIRHSEAEAWRTRLIEAAQGFSEAITATTSVFYLLLGDPTTISEERVEKVEHHLLDAALQAMRIGLLFGDDTAAAESAQETGNHLADALGKFRYALKLSPTVRVGALDAVRKTVDLADEAHDKFMRAAHAAIRP